MINSFFKIWGIIVIILIIGYLCYSVIHSISKDLDNPTTKFSVIATFFVMVPLTYFILKK